MRPLPDCSTEDRPEALSQPDERLAGTGDVPGRRVQRRRSRRAHGQRDLEANAGAAGVHRRRDCGYLVGGGKALRDCSGKVEPIKKTEKMRLAHPVDLLASKAWTNWQHDCFTSERTQPFKQVFRELYVLTSQEKSDATFSRRYAGHQVNPRQAMALLGGRGWVTAPEQGIFRTFHDEKLVAWLEFLETFYTPAEVEGLTLEKVRFAHGRNGIRRLTDVPARLQRSDARRRPGRERGPSRGG